MEERKYLDIGELKDLGYLQELNRQFLHPLGLALEVCRDVDDDTGETGPWTLGGVWDYRDDPEGMRYADEYLRSDEAIAKADHVYSESMGRREGREKLGYWVQPLPRPYQQK